MTGVLNPDPEKFADALAAEGAAPVIAVRSASSPHVCVIAARLRRQELAVAPDGTISLPPLQRGVNVLFLNVEGAAEGEEVQIVEHAEGAAEPRVIRTKRMGRTGFGAEPVLRFEINVP